MPNYTEKKLVDYEVKGYGLEHNNQSDACEKPSFSSGKADPGGYKPPRIDSPMTPMPKAMPKNSKPLGKGHMGE
jgi:hypothetical protein